MEKLIIEEMCKNLKWHEKIIVVMHKKIFYKAYRIGAVECFNFYNK